MDLNKVHHGRLLNEIKNAVERWISVVCNYDDSQWLKLHQFDNVVNLLQTCLYNVSATNLPMDFEPHYVHRCASN